MVPWTHWTHKGPSPLGSSGGLQSGGGWSSSHLRCEFLTDLSGKAGIAGGSLSPIPSLVLPFFPPLSLHPSLRFPGGSPTPQWSWRSQTWQIASPAPNFPKAKVEAAWIPVAWPWKSCSAISATSCWRPQPAQAQCGRGLCTDRATEEVEDACTWCRAGGPGAGTQLRLTLKVFLPLFPAGKARGETDKFTYR